MTGLEPGSTLGGYRILARIRAGAMGVLYLARRLGPKGFARPVAIKVIHDHLAQNSRFSRMFIDEAKLSARIDDPNVVRVEEFGEADGRYFLVMEYVHGCSLAQVIALTRDAGGIGVDAAVAIGMQICAGLHGAHEAADERGVSLGIVHRDVSPHNVLVSYKGYVRIIDFGIAKARQVGGQTKTGSLRGKLAYMPPEQARSARTVDRRADLYAAGLVIWEMLTGRRLFDADTDIAVLNQIRNPKIVPPSKLAPGVPKALDAAILKALSQSPEGRPATAAEMQRLLADAHPPALRVTAGDLAALMARVRAAATAAAPHPKPEDPASLYGEEIRTSLTAVGDAVEDDPTSPDEKKKEAPTNRRLRPSREPPPPIDDATVAMVDRPARPSGPSLDAATRGELPPSVRGAAVVEEERTAKLRARERPGVVSVSRASQPTLVTPVSGVNVGAPRGAPPVALSTPAPSSPSGLAFPPPEPWVEWHAPPPEAKPASLQALVAKHPWAPIVAIVVGALAIPLGLFVALSGPRTSAPRAQASGSGAAVATAAAPPPTVPAAHVLGPNDKPSPWREGEDPFTLALQGDEGAAKARRTLEDRGVDKLGPEELRLLHAICKRQKDAACVARVEQAGASPSTTRAGTSPPPRDSAGAKSRL